MKGIKNKSVISLVGCCLATFWSGAVAFGYPGIMSTYWQELYDVGSSETGLVVTIMLLAISLCTIFSGRFLNRFGIRACILTGTALMLCGMLILINAQNIYTVYIWAFVMNLGASFVYGPGLTTAQQWMPHRKGLASGLVNLTFGLSAAVMTPVWEFMLENSGYSSVNINLIVCIVVTNVIAAVLVITPENTAAEEVSGRSAPHSADFTPLQAVRTKRFWLMWCTWAVVGAAGISMVSLSKSYAVSLGLSGAIVLMAFNITNGGGRLIAGWLCDIIGGELTAVIAFVIATAGYVLLPFAGSLVSISILVACIGYGFGTLFASTGPVATGYFGMKNFGSIFGLIFTGYGCAGGIIGPLLSGIILENTGGNYVIVFSYLAVFSLLGVIFMSILKRTSGKNI